MDKLGFGADNAAQVMVDEQVLTLCEPYVPFDVAGIYPNPKTLINSGKNNTILGSGLVKYRTPYARYLYYHPEFDYQGAPMRGAYWADRAMQDGGKAKVVAALKEFVGRRSKSR